MKKLYLSLTCFVVAIAAGCSSAPQQPVSTDAVAVDNNALRPTMSTTAFDRRFRFTPEQYEAALAGELDGYGGSEPLIVDLRYPRVDEDTAPVDNSDLVAGGGSIESPISQEQIDRLRALAEAQMPASGVQIIEQDPRRGLRPGPELGNVFDSIGAEDCCDGLFGATVPPDSEMTVGGDHLIATVNVTVEVYTKRGHSVAGPVAFGNVFPPEASPFGICSGQIPFDPDVIYDEEAERYIIGYDGGGAFYCMLVSTGPDPFEYYAYWFNASQWGCEFFDFPHMGVGTDNIFIGSNNFGCVRGFAGVVHAVNKWQLYSGVAPDVAKVRQNLPRFDGTPQPANVYGVAEGTFPTNPNAPHYIMSETFDGEHHSVYAWRNPWGVNSFNRLGDVDLALATGVPCPAQSCFPIDVEQPDGGFLFLAGNDFRGQETKYRNGSLWTAQTISCNPGSGTVNCVRWAEIDPTAVVRAFNSTRGVIQAGVFAGDDGSSRWFPSLNVNMCGDMVIGYSVAGPDRFASVAVTGRRAGDPLGTVRSEVDVMDGTELYRSFDWDIAPATLRWGDYSGMAIDPNGVDFYHIGEYSGPSDNPFSNWRNAISMSRFECGAPAERGGR